MPDHANPIELEIREAVAGDGPKIAQIYSQSADAHVGYDADFYSHADTQSIADSFVTDGPMSHCSALLVAESEGEVVGFMQLEYTPGSLLPTMYGWSRKGRVYIEELAVEESHRGKGIGRLLLRAADEWAKERNVSTLGLSTHAANVGAQHLYESEGYRALGLTYTKDI